MAERPTPPLAGWLEALPLEPLPGNSCTWLAGGANNQGVLLHRLPPGPPGRPALVVEKRSRNNSEVRLLRRIQAWQAAGGGRDLLPLILGICRGGAGWRLFQSYIPEAAAVPTDPDLAGRWVAGLALRWHGAMAELLGPQPPPVSRVFAQQLGRLEAALGDCGAPPELVALLQEVVTPLRPRLFAQPLVFSHNDLHWANIRAMTAPVAAGSLQAPADPGHRLIDLGRCGWNLPGAEFHVFLRQSLTGLGGPPVWRHALEHYGAAADAAGGVAGGADPTALRLGCLWFALVQAAAQWRLSRLQGRGALVRRDGRLVRRLLGRLRAALEDGGADPAPPGC